MTVIDRAQRTSRERSKNYGGPSRGRRLAEEEEEEEEEMLHAVKTI